MIETLRASPFSAMPRDVPNTWEDERELLTGERRPVDALVFVRNSDRREPEDFGYGGSPALLLVSDAFVDALRDAGCTGWDSNPVVIENKRGALLGHRRQLVVTGTSGPLQAPTEPTDPARPRWTTGLSFDVEEWDGADLFVARASGGMVFSRRAMDALVAANLRGFQFTALDEVETYLADEG